MLSLYSATVPVLVRGLGTLSRYVDAASSFAREAKTDPAALVGARLAPGMLPFVGQIQAACDNVKNGVARLIGAEAPRFEDDERTLLDLRFRIDRTADLLAAVRPHDLEGAEERLVVLSFRVVSGAMTGRDYALKLLLPNFFFHVSMAHGILRQSGVPIGKRDYLGALDDASHVPGAEVA